MMGWFQREALPRNAFNSNRFSSISTRYQALLRSNPFLAFGLPFMSSMVLASFLLTPATAVRYERFDRKTHSIDREEAMKMGFQNLGNPTGEGSKDAATKDDKKEKKTGGKFKNKDIREEYFKLAGQSQKLDDWEPIRVERKPGEPDGTF